MSPRTLSRRIRSATGRSTLALVQAIRLRRAKTLLESSRLPIDRDGKAQLMAQRTLANPRENAGDCALNARLQIGFCWDLRQLLDIHDVCALRNVALFGDGDLENPDGAHP